MRQPLGIKNLDGEDIYQDQRLDLDDEPGVDHMVRGIDKGELVVLDYRSGVEKRLPIVNGVVALRWPKRDTLS